MSDTRYPCEGFGVCAVGTAGLICVAALTTGLFCAIALTTGLLGAAAVAGRFGGALIPGLVCAAVFAVRLGMFRHSLVFDFSSCALRLTLLLHGPHSHALLQRRLYTSHTRSTPTRLLRRLEQRHATNHAVALHHLLLLGTLQRVVRRGPRAPLQRGHVERARERRSGRRGS